MKNIKIYILLLALISSSQAVSIQYTNTANEDIVKIMHQKDELFNKIQNYRKEIQASELNKLFDENLMVLKNNFLNLKIEKNSNKIVYSKNKNYILKGINQENNIQPYEQLAFNFLHNIFSYTKYEEIKILNVREEYGAEQEKDKNGKISSNVNIKTYSYDVIIGKKLFDKPIFNAIATMEIDPKENKIISFELENWTPITDSEGNYLKKLSPEYIKDRIKNTIAQKSNNKEEVFKIEGIDIGWIADKNSKKIVPAFLHHGIIINTGKNTNYNTAKEKYSFYFIERLDKLTKIKQQPSSGMESQKYRQPKKPNIENKIIETQGEKDNKKNILFNKTTNKIFKF